MIFVDFVAAAPSGGVEPETVAGIPTSALFGLLGVLIGAAIAIFGEVWLERHRDKRDDQRLTATTDRESCAAARLVDAELRTAFATCVTALARNEWWPEPYELSRTVFDSNRELLARTLDDKAWNFLSFVYDEQLPVIAAHRIERYRGHPGDVPISFTKREARTCLTFLHGCLKARRRIAELSNPFDKEELLSSPDDEFLTASIDARIHELSRDGSVGAIVAEPDPAQPGD